MKWTSNRRNNEKEDILDKLPHADALIAFDDDKYDVRLRITQ